MKKTCFSLVIVSVALVALAALAPNTLAQSLPSYKATAAVNTAVGCTATSSSSPGITAVLDCHDIWSGNATAVTPDNFATIMSVPIKVSNSQSLFASPSLVTGLYTQTLVTAKTGGGKSTATAEGGVFLRAVLSTDAAGLKVVQVADPVGMCDNDILGCQKVGGQNGSFGVVLDSRIQTLSQELSNCVVNVVVGGVPISGICSFSSTIDLLLKTTSAHTFNFIFPHVGQGVYYVVIQAAVDANAVVSSTSNLAVGSAAFGLGSLTVESVRLVHDFSYGF